jgi:protease I
VEATVDLSEARIVVLAENQYQELELWYPVLRFRDSGSDVLVAAPRAGQLYSSKLGLPVVSDIAVDALDAADIDVLIIPGGFAPEAMRKSPELLELVRKTYDGGGIVAAICHAGWVLASTGIAKGKRLTCVPIIRDDVIHAGGEYLNEPVVRDGNLITSRLPNDLPVFCSEIAAALSELSGHRGDGITWPPARTPRASAAFSDRAHLVQAPAGRATANYTTTASLSES